MATPSTAKSQNGKVEELQGSPVTQRVDRLRTLSENDAPAAQAAAWAWITEAGRRIQKDREGALEELGELFRTGSASTGLDGATEGMLVGFTMHPAADRTLAAITSAWLPWAGKRFNAAEQKGDNLLLKSASAPSKLLWPLYKMRDAGANVAAFDFETRIEPGAVDPDREVLVIDYAPVDSNPRVIIKSIRDELVQIVPGAHLGKMLWRQKDGYALLAYFALKSAV